MATTEYLKDSNEHLLFLLPGQSLSPRAFWDFKTPENTTHSQYFLESGIDVILFDPVGYGDSRGILNGLSFRDKQAEQLINVVEYLEQRYSKIYLHGFCSTYHLPLIVANKKSVAGLLLLSPYLLGLTGDEFNQTFNNLRRKL